MGNARLGAGASDVQDRVSAGAWTKGLTAAPPRVRVQVHGVGRNMIREQEIELKLEVDEAGARMLRRHPMLMAEQGTPTEQLSVYFDTPDATLRDAGFSLRVRKSGDRYTQTIKQGGNGTSGLFHRPEWECNVDGADPDLVAAAATPLGDVITKKVAKRLRSMFRSEVRRTIWNLKRDGGEVELALDEGQIIAGKQREAFAELELELKSGAPETLLELARELAGEVPMRLGVLTKAERGYALAEGRNGAAAKAEPIILRSSMTVAQGFARVVHGCLRHYRINERLLLERRDPLALHQARVAMRRLRSAFTLFRPAIADDEDEQLREELRWFTSQLGDARNLDVLMKRLSNAPGNKSGKSLGTKLEAARQRAYDHALEAIGSARLRRLMLELVMWLEAGEWRERKAATKPLPGFLARQLDRRWRKVRKAGAKMASLDAEHRHRLRIDVKKLRYSLEFSSFILGRQDERKAFLAQLEEMQEHLGELNDVETAGQLLGRILGDDVDGKSLRHYALGHIRKSSSEVEQLAAGERAFERLAAIGRFWRPDPLPS